MHFRFPRLVGFQLRPILAQLFDDFLTDSELFHVDDEGLLLLPTAFCVLRVRLLFAPPPRRSFDDIGWFHRPAVVVYLHALFLFSGRRRRRRRKMPVSSRRLFSPPRRQKSATQSIYAKTLFTHPFTSLLLAKQKKRVEIPPPKTWRRSKPSNARARRGRVFVMFLSRSFARLLFDVSKRKQIRSSVKVAFIFPFFFSFFSFFFGFSILERERGGV